MLFQTTATNSLVYRESTQPLVTGSYLRTRDRLQLPDASIKYLAQGCQQRAGDLKSHKHKGRHCAFKLPSDSPGLPNGGTAGLEFWAEEMKSSSICLSSEILAPNQADVEFAAFLGSGILAARSEIQQVEKDTDEAVASVSFQDQGHPQTV